MVLLMNPFTVALEVDLSGRAGFTVKVHRLVLDNVSFFRLNEKMRKRFWGIRRKGLWELMEKIIICRKE